MPTNYPTSFDSLPDPDYGLPMSESDPKHSEDHQGIRDAVKAIEEKVGIDGDTNANSIDKRVSDLEATPAIGDHDHDGVPTQKLNQINTHENADTDSATSALHHTIGTGANNAAAGDHVHAMSPVSSAYTWMSRTYLQTGVGRRFYADRPGTITGIYAWATDSAPTTTLTYDVLKNDSSIFSSQPTITPGNFLGATAVPTVTSFVAGDKLEIELVSLGGIIEGKIGVCIQFDGV